MNPNFGENIDEIKDEEISDDEELNEEQNKKNKIENFVGQLNPEENIVNIDDEFDNNTNSENEEQKNNDIKIIDNTPLKIDFSDEKKEEFTPINEAPAEEEETNNKKRKIRDCYCSRRSRIKYIQEWV